MLVQNNAFVKQSLTVARLLAGRRGSFRGALQGLSFKDLKFFPQPVGQPRRDQGLPPASGPLPRKGAGTALQGVVFPWGFFSTKKLGERKEGSIFGHLPTKAEGI
jgi:hypothetical protein